MIPTKFSNTAIDKAGEILQRGSHLDLEFDRALEFINAWRSAHSYPLQAIKMLLLIRARRIHSGAIIAQRLKRLHSIRAKLELESTRLSQMQDIGGCRAIMLNMQHVTDLRDKFLEAALKNPRSRHQLLTPKDYIENPKPDGYRSVHLILKYQSAMPKNRNYNGFRIEVQLRTRLQHAWATAVEVVDIFSGKPSLKTSLKTQIGDDKWRRFFVLMGSAMAMREHAPLVPNTPTSKANLVKELKNLADEISALHFLGGLGHAVNVLSANQARQAAAYILILDADKKNVTVRSYTDSDLSNAQTEYLELEKSNATNPHVQVVQVAVDSIDLLKTAYPNYYLDTTVFLQVLRQLI